MLVTALQFVVAIYVMYVVVKDISHMDVTNACFLGQDAAQRDWKKILMASFLVLLWLVVIIQCVTGSDILRWRSFYATHDRAWKAHYREVFDHGIREALCCLGRVKYLSVLEEDEVYSVARLLGDLVAYRASGTGHFELLAGLALLQKQKQSSKLYEELIEAPEARLQEAASFQRFSEAAYTGPLLDFGRNPVLFPCAWLHRQGVWTPWTRNRRPHLDGDNRWRGHAAAFLNFVSLPPAALRRGRVSQRKREAAYFIVVHHDLKSVVVAVRGTETPEDLLTDGLCRECNLSLNDLDGLINSHQLPPSVRETVMSTFPHYGHSGIVESARELFKQIDGHPGEDDSSYEQHGFLSSLLGNGCECDGYRLIIVGHSLGGAVATLLGVRLYARYPYLHVYAYGALPCVDLVTAEACSDFVTSIVYNDEFSARLSINSIVRLRAAAIAALSTNSSADSALISKLARRILNLSKCNENMENGSTPTSPTYANPDTGEDGNHVHKRRTMKNAITGGVLLCGHAVTCIVNAPDQCGSSQVIDDVTSEHQMLSEKGPDPYHGKSSPFNGTDTRYVNEHSNGYTYPNFENDGMHECCGSKPMLIGSSDFKGHAADTSTSVEVSIREVPEVYLAGLVIHIIPEERSTSTDWKDWLRDDKGRGYKAVLANRKCLRDIVVSPFMFLDHLPWRCHYALQRVLETRKMQEQLQDDLLSGEVMV